MRSTVKRLSKNDLKGAGLKAYINIDPERVHEVFGEPHEDVSWFVEFPNGSRANVFYRLGDDETLHIRGFNDAIADDVSQALETGVEYVEDSTEEIVGGSTVLKHDPSILCRDDTFRYIVTLDQIRRKYENFPSWIRITTITMTCKIFASERINLDMIRAAFQRNDGNIRIRRKGALFDGHSWSIKDTTFYNQVTVGYVDRYSTKSIKVFPNGSFQVAGCSDLYDCQRVAKQLAFLLTVCLELETPLTHEAFRVVMINTNFSMNRPINLMDIVDTLSTHENMDVVDTLSTYENMYVSFNPSSYSAVKIKFNPRPDMKLVTASVFSTGKIIVTGAETLKEIVFAYDILNTELLRFTYDSTEFLTAFENSADNLRELTIEAVKYYSSDDILEMLEMGDECEIANVAEHVAKEIQKKKKPDSFDTVLGAKFDAWVDALKQRGVKVWN